MTINLSKLSREELEELAKNVQAALVDAVERERRAALDALEKTAKAHGFKLGELTSELSQAVRGQRGKGKSKNPPKYRNPEDPKQTWTGRGRKPAWIKDAETAGTDLATFEI